MAELFAPAVADSAPNADPITGLGSGVGRGLGVARGLAVGVGLGVCVGVGGW